jgi:peptidase E
LKNSPIEKPAVDFNGASLEDLVANPHKFGCPSFEEYVKLREKYQPREDEAMISLTDGPNKYRNDLNKIKFQVNGFDMKEEQVEKALGDHGYALADIDLENRDSKLKKEIDMIPLGGGKYDLVVNFKP